MIRKKRKITKMRGSRTVGGGCSKKRKGAGHRGGRGKAGGHKHHWSWIVKYDPKYFGKSGFKRPKSSLTDPNPVNINYLDEKADQLLDKGLASTENDKLVIDVTKLGYNKVLGQGRITKAMIIKSPQFSGSAEKKIQESGGEAQII